MVENIHRSKHITEHFNNSFTSIGKNLQKGNLPTKKHFSSFLKNPNTEPFVITPTAIEEVNDLTSGLKTSQSTGPTSLPTKIMEQLNDIIISPLYSQID